MMLIFLFISIVGFIMFLILALVPSEREVDVKKRIERLRARTALRRREAVSFEMEGFTEKVGFYISQKLQPVLRKILPSRYFESIEKRLIMAGQYDATVGRFMAQKFGGLIFIGILGGGVAYVMFHMSTLNSVIIGILAGIFGFFIPDISLSGAIKKRHELIDKQLPDFLDQLVTSVKAGLAPNAAFQFTTRRFKPGPIREEFEIALQEIFLGSPRMEALARIGERTGHKDIKRMVAMLMYGEKLGVPISQTLSSVAEDLRNKRWEAAEEKAQKAPVKITFPMILLILPTIFLIIIGTIILNYLYNVRPSS